MKSRLIRSCIPVAVAVIVMGSYFAGAGNINPPVGVVSPTMKTLVEVEPRSLISSLPTTITQSGSYYLTGNLTGASGQSGITVSADNVSIDLRGFTLIGVAGSLKGISIPATRTNLSITNGIVRSWGGDGIDAFNASNANLLNLTVSSNGGAGLKLGGNGTITQCMAQSNGAGGISTTAATVIDRCTATGNTGNGIVASEGSMVTRCASRGNTADGIVVTNNSAVEESIATLNGSGGTDAGIHVIGTGNRIDGNHVTNSNSRGIKVDSSGNLIVRNSTRSSTVAGFDIAAGNDYAQILASPGASFSSSVAWANFSDVNCPGGQTLCNNVCVNTQNDNQNCGNCGHVCPGGQSCVNGACVANPTCTDGIKNGTETGIDCGGGTCPTCPNGQGCNVNGDCTSGRCSGGVCVAATCNDGIKDGNETGIDCGGGTCPTCPIGQGCITNGDCSSGHCSGGFCVAATCNDLIKDGSETGIDCGGGSCPTCPNGQGCLGNSDCQSNHCVAGSCVP